MILSRSTRTLVFACALLGALLAGCSKPSVIVLTPRSGGDFGQQLKDAINSCAPGSCYIDGREVTGPQTSADNIVIDRPLTTVEVAFSSLTFAPGKNLQLAASHIAFTGPSMFGSAIQCQARSKPCVYVGTHDTAGIYGVILSDLNIIPVSADATNAAGIVIENARGPGAMLDHVSVDSFSSGAALRVLEGAWTWTVKDSQFIRSGRGIEMLGDQANAWVFERNLINSNLAEGVWLKLCDYPSSYGGCTSNGIVFSDGNHFEANSGPGIRLVNGSYYNLDIRDSYGELNQANTGYFEAMNDGTLNGQLRVSGMLVDGGGGYVSGGVPINLIDGTQGYDYGAAPVPIRSLQCADGNCTVITAQPHGLTCPLVQGYALCPFVRLKGTTDEAVFRLTGVQSPVQFTFFLNGIRNATSGTVQYAEDLINVTISNQHWDSSWTAPEITSSTGSGVTLIAHDNSVLDGLGFLVGDTTAKRRR